MMPRTSTMPVGSALSLLAALSLVPTPPAVAQQLPRGTLLVANMNDDSVWLLDTATGERVGVIATRVPPHEVVVSSDGATAAVTNYGDRDHGPGNLVQFIDIRTAKVTHEIEVAGHVRLHGAAFLPGDSLLALTSEQTGEVLIVSVADGAIRRTLSTGGRTPHMIALAGPWIWTANIMDGSIARLDPSKESAPNVWPADAGARTEGVAATPDGAEGWTASMQDGVVTGVRGADGSVVARIEGLKVPYRLAVTSDGATVVVTDPEAGTVVLIDRGAGKIAASIDVNAAARAAGFEGDASPQGFTLSPDGRWAFVSTKGIDRVAAIDLAARRVVRFLETGAGPDGVAFSTVR
jgi:DNA-binding beta-propeller fold protein YncE